MKTKTLLLGALLSLGLFASSLSARADGSLIFNNYSPSFPEARVFERDPYTLQLTLVPTNGGKVELLYAPAGTTDFSLYRPVAGKSPVSIAPIPGVFAAQPYRLTGIEPGAVISAVVRGWTGDFASWDDALNSGTAKVGVSDIFQVDTSDPDLVPAPVPANILTSVPGQGFAGLILQIPEPTSLSLFVSSLFGMALARQRRAVH